MGRYLTDLVTKDIGGGFHELTQPLIYESSAYGLIVVPSGFRTNFASVPRLPFVFLLFGGVGDKEATLHDWLYTPPHRLTSWPSCEHGSVDRGTADRIFRGARYAADYCPLVEYESVNLWALVKNVWAYFGAWCMWAGVRLFGWRHWRS